MEQISLVGPDRAFEIERYFFLHFCTKWELFLKADLQRGEIEIRRSHPAGVGNSVSFLSTFHAPWREMEQRLFLCTVQEKDGSGVDCRLLTQTKQKPQPFLPSPAPTSGNLNDRDSLQKDWFILQWHPHACHRKLWVHPGSLRQDKKACVSSLPTSSQLLTTGPVAGMTVSSQLDRQCPCRNSFPRSLPSAGTCL